VIIRIATEGQYQLKGDALSKLDEIDNRLLDAIETGDEATFREALDAVLSLIRSEGQRLSDTELKESDLIVAPPDTTLEEARDLFAGYPRDLT